MVRFASPIALHLAAFTLAGVSGWRDVEYAVSLPPASHFSFIAFDIAQRNILSLCLLVAGNFCTIGIAGMLMMGGNGYQFSLAVKMVGTDIWWFAPLEIVSFCCAGGVSQYMSLFIVRWLIGMPKEAVKNTCVSGVLVVGVSCVALAVAAIVEAVVLLQGRGR